MQHISKCFDFCAFSLFLTAALLYSKCIGALEKDFFGKTAIGKIPKANFWKKICRKEIMR